MSESEYRRLGGDERVESGDEWRHPRNAEGVWQKIGIPIGCTPEDFKGTAYEFRRAVPREGFEGWHARECQRLSYSTIPCGPDGPMPGDPAGSWTWQRGGTVVFDDKFDARTCREVWEQERGGAKGERVTRDFAKFATGARDADATVVCHDCGVTMRWALMVKHAEGPPCKPAPAPRPEYAGPLYDPTLGEGVIQIWQDQEDRKAAVTESPAEPALLAHAPLGPGLSSDPAVALACPSCRTRTDPWEPRCRACCYGAKPIPMVFSETRQNPSDRLPR